MLFSTLTIVFVSALILLFISFYRRTPGAGGPSLEGWRGAYEMALVPAGVLVVVVFGFLRVRSLGSS